MLTLRQLEALYWTAKLGSFSRAAAHLKVTQSAISMRISELEAHLNLELFRRGRSTPVITPYGRELVSYSERILRLCSEAQERISGTAAVPEILRIGFAEVVSMTWLPDLVQALKEHYPSVKLSLEEGLIDEVLGGLRHGSLDLALAAMPSRIDQVESLSLGSVRYEWMASPTLRLPKRKLTPSDLQKMPIIGLSQKSVHFEKLAAWFTAGGAEYRPVYTCRSMHTASVLAIAGLGITMLPVQLYGEDVKLKRLVVVETKPALPMVEFYAISLINNLDPIVRYAASLAAEASDFEKRPSELDEKPA
jgi:DNA-binding transcriptional LysR family regulator